MSVLTLEANIERWVCNQALLKLGVRSLKLNVRGQTGWPDRMFMVPGGRPLFVEFKRPGGELSERQKYMIKILSHKGYEVQVHDNAERAFQAIAAAVMEAVD